MLSYRYGKWEKKTVSHWCHSSKNYGFSRMWFTMSASLRELNDPLLRLPMSWACVCRTVAQIYLGQYRIVELFF